MLKENKLEEVIPKPKPRTTLKSYMEPGETARLTDGDSQFCGPVREPTSTELKKMIALLIASGVDVVMSNHYYTIGGTIRLQTDG